MLKTIKTILTQDKERYTVPRRVQDIIPITCIWPDGIFKVGGKFAKSFKFTDINYMVASREDKENMFLTYSELLNSLDSGATTKITIYNHRMNEADFEDTSLMPMQGDWRDEYREEYNRMLLDKAVNAEGVMQEKFITISIAKKTVEEARAFDTSWQNKLCVVSGASKRTNAKVQSLAEGATEKVVLKATKSNYFVDRIISTNKK